MANHPGVEIVAELDPESPRGGRPRDEAREQAILEAALDLLAEVGYDAMSMEAVAVRARASKATIYRRWGGKAELVAEALKRRSEPLMVEPEDTGSLRGDLMGVVTTMLENMAGIDGGLMVGLATAVRADADLGRALAGKKRDYHERLASLIVSRAEARGELPSSADPRMLFDVAPGVALFRQMRGEPLDAEFAEYLVDRILIPLLRS
jgi:AcrR family transcriptional regulator